MVVLEFSFFFERAVSACFLLLLPFINYFKNQFLILVLPNANKVGRQKPDNYKTEKLIHV